MKKIFFVFVLIGNFLFAENFSFDPANDDFNKLFQFCVKSHKHGVILDNDDKKICNYYANQALDFYINDCEMGNQTSCSIASSIYYSGLGDVLPNEDKSLEFGKKACELGRALNCHNVGTTYSILMHKDKNNENEYRKQAKYYYKKACDLGHKFSCDQFSKL